MIVDYRGPLLIKPVVRFWYGDDETVFHRVIDCKFPKIKKQERAKLSKFSHLGRALERMRDKAN